MTMTNEHEQALHEQLTGEPMVPLEQVWEQDLPPSHRTEPLTPEPEPKVIEVGYKEHPGQRGFVARYTDEDYRALGKFMRDNHTVNPERVRVFLSVRQNRPITLSAAKNVVTRGRSLGLIAPGKRPYGGQPSGAKNRPKAAPKPTVVEEGPSLPSVDEVVHVVAGFLYSDGNIPSKHLYALLEWRDATAKLLAKISP